MIVHIEEVQLPEFAIVAHPINFMWQSTYLWFQHVRQDVTTIWHHKCGGLGLNYRNLKHHILMLRTGY